MSLQQYWLAFIKAAGVLWFLPAILFRFLQYILPEKVLFAAIFWINIFIFLGAFGYLASVLRKRLITLGKKPAVAGILAFVLMFCTGGIGFLVVGFINPKRMQQAQAQFLASLPEEEKKKREMAPRMFGPAVPAPRALGISLKQYWISLGKATGLLLLGTVVPFLLVLFLPIHNNNAGFILLVLLGGLAELGAFWLATRAAAGRFAVLGLPTWLAWVMVPLLVFVTFSVEKTEKSWAFSFYYEYLISFFVALGCINLKSSNAAKKQADTSAGAGPSTAAQKTAPQDVPLENFAPRKRPQFPPLLLAVAAKDIPQMQSLYAADSSVLTETDWNTGNNALHVAALNGYSEIVLWLLSKGADPFVTNQGGQTPLDLAQAHHQADAAALLEKYMKA